MDCNDIKNKLFDIAENRLPETELSAAREHIAACDPCKAMVSTFSSYMEVIAKERKAEYSPFLAARIIQKMESHGLYAGRTVTVHMPKILQPVIATALILLAILTGFLAGRQGKHFNPASAGKSSLEVMKSDFFISELNDEDKTMKLYK